MVRCTLLKIGLTKTGISKKMSKIKCELKETKRDLVARVTIPNYMFVVPPHRGVSLDQAFTNEKELKEVIKKMLSEAVDNMEVVLDEEK